MAGNFKKNFKRNGDATLPFLSLERANRSYNVVTFHFNFFQIFTDHVMAVNRVSKRLCDVAVGCVCSRFSENRVNRSGNVVSFTISFHFYRSRDGRQDMVISLSVISHTWQQRFCYAQFNSTVKYFWQRC